VKHILAILSFLFMNACSDEPALRIAPQNWGDIKIQLETRPPMPTSGMNEILVIVNHTGEKRMPVWDSIIALRADESDNWHQAIQDGHTGVYRRAVKVTDPATQDVQVQIQRGGDKVVLRFPLHTLQ